jgi:crotonobetainyl-CoA:carnitine CoA-transferase CaiB-like acyl-CoA transferase
VLALFHYPDKALRERVFRIYNEYMASLQEPSNGRAAPLLGEHNHELLGELGLTSDEIAALEDDGVIGTAPAMGGRRKAAC